MLVYDSQYSKFFLGVPGILLAAGALAVIFDAAKWITAIVLAILGGAFIVRAFDIDKAFSSFGRLTPTSFIKIFSIIGGKICQQYDNSAMDRDRYNSWRYTVERLVQRK
jgi:putative membrane protein